MASGAGVTRSLLEFGSIYGPVIGPLPATVGGIAEDYGSIYGPAVMQDKDYENPGAATEFSDANDRLLVSTIEASGNVYRNEDQYLGWDKGASAYPGDYTFSGQVIVPANANQRTFFVGVSDTTGNDFKGIDDANGDYEGVFVHDTEIFKLQACNGGVTTTDDSASLSVGTLYYYLFWRDGGTVYFRYGTDPDPATTYTEELTVSSPGTSWRYVWIIQNKNTGSPLLGDITSRRLWLSATAPESGQDVAPDVLTATFSVPAPTVFQDLTSTPDALSATFSIPAPQVELDFNVTPDVLSGTFSIPTPTINQDFNVVPDVLSATFSIPAPQIALGLTVTPDVLSATLSIPTPSVIQDLTATPDVLTASFSIPAPTAFQDLTATPDVLTAVFTIPAYAVTITGAQDVNLTAPLTLTFSIPTPTVGIAMAITGVMTWTSAYERIIETAYERVVHSLGTTMSVKYEFQEDRATLVREQLKQKIDGVLSNYDISSSDITVNFRAFEKQDPDTLLVDTAMTKVIGDAQAGDTGIVTEKISITGRYPDVIFRIVVIDAAVVDANSKSGNQEFVFKEWGGRVVASPQ